MVPAWHTPTGIPEDRLMKGERRQSDGERMVRTPPRRRGQSATGRRLRIARGSVESSNTGDPRGKSRPVVRDGLMHLDGLALTGEWVEHREGERRAHVVSRTAPLRHGLAPQGTASSGRCVLMEGIHAALRKYGHPSVKALKGGLMKKDRR